MEKVYAALPQAEEINENKESQEQPNDEVPDGLPDVISDFEEIMENILQGPVSNDPMVLIQQVNILTTINKTLIGVVKYRLGNQTIPKA